jgi:hypothetical protein
MVYCLSIAYGNSKYLRVIGWKKFISNKVNILNISLVTAFTAFSYVRWSRLNVGLPLGIRKVGTV